jgi:hypothetical protein
VHGNPSIAVVSGQRKVVFELRPHDSLMIVRRGIDQVAEFFIRRPGIG